jgi:hypothetical protein
MLDSVAAEPWLVLALPIVLTFCWWWRERTKRNSRTALIRDYRELVTDLAKLEPEHVERLHARLERIQPPDPEAR